MTVSVIILPDYMKLPGKDDADMSRRISGEQDDFILAYILHFRSEAL